MERTVIFVALPREKLVFADEKGSTLVKSFKKEREIFGKCQFFFQDSFKKITKGRIGFLVVWLEKTPTFFSVAFFALLPH